MERTELFETMPVPRAVMKLCIPSILSSLVMILYNLSDTYFVGLTNDPVQTAAVTLVGPVLLGFNAVNNLFGVGASSMMSRALGMKDIETVKRSSSFGFYMSLFIALAISVITAVFRGPVLAVIGTDATTVSAAGDYLFWTTILGAAPSIINVLMAYLVRSEGASLHASIGTMSGCILNIVIDPIFILPWGFNMGAGGAGCATFISNCAACVYFFILLFVKRGKTCVCIDIRKMNAGRKTVKEIFYVGVPSMLQNLLNALGLALLNIFTAGFGELAVAAMGITSKLYLIPIQINMGIAMGTMPLVGYNYSSGNTGRLKKSVRFSILFAISVITVVCLAFIIFAPQLVSLFMDNDKVVEYGSWFLRAFCAGMPFLCVDYAAVSVFQGCGLGRTAFIIAILRKLALEIPALVILKILFPLYGLPFATLIAEVILAAVGIVLLKRLFAKLEKQAGTTAGI